MNAYQKILNEMAAATATNERAVSTGKPIYNPVPKPMSFQEFHQGYQQAKQQAIIAGASSEAARQEHIALMEPKRVANINGVYYPKGQPGGNSRLMQVGQGQQRVVLPGQQTFTRLGTGFNTGYKTEAAQQGLSYITEMKNQAKAQYDAYIASPEYTRQKEKNLRLDMLDAYSASETAGAVQPRQDQKEVELKTMVDFWTQQENAQNDRVTTMRNVQEFLSWSEEDQQKMRLFNANRAGRLAYFSASADQANTRQAYENAERLGLARAAEMELAQKYGEDKVQKIAESLSRVENEAKTNAAREKYSNVEDGFWPGLWASIEGRAYNAAGSVTGTLGQMQNLIIKPTGQYSTLDPNNLGNLPNVVGQTLTGAVAENIRGQKPTAGSEALAAIYKAGMSSADSLIRAYMGGGVKGISRALIASSAFGNAMAEYSAQGASPMEAVLMSTVDAGLEVLTEEIPLDRIIKQAEIAPASLGQWLKESAKSAVIEMGEEGTNFIGSAIAQSVILRDKSEYNQNIAQLMMQGVDYQQAKAAADREMVMQGAMTLIESAMSGGMMGGAAQAVGAARAKGLGIKLDRAGVTQENINEVIRDGLAQDPQTPAYQVAQEMQQKLSKGKSLSQYDMGRLYQSSVMTGQQGEQNTDTAEQNTITAEQNPVTAEQNNNTGVQTDNTGVESDVNAVQTGEQADTEEQGVKDIMQPEQETVVTANDEVPLEELGADWAAMLGRLGRITGRKVHAYTKPKGLQVVENGFFLNGEIWINTEGDLPHLQVFSHELTHSIEGSKLYGTLKQIALERFAQGVDIDNYRTEQKRLYEANGQTVTPEELDREIVANYVSQYLLRDEKSIRELAKKQRPIATKILNWIDGMLVKHRGSEKAEERIFLRNTRQLYAQALKETTGMRYPAADSQTTGIGQAEQTMQTGKQWTEREPRSMEEYRDYVEEMYRNGDMDEETYEQKLEMFHQMEETGELKKKFSYAGQGARTADLQSLETARQMEEQEVSAETIRQQTGWFRGDDGKWRFDTGTDNGTQEDGIENKKTPSGVDGEEEDTDSGQKQIFSSNSGYDFSKSFEQQLTDFQQGVFPERDSFVLGGTPSVLQKIGLANLPLTINQKHINESLNGTYKGSDQEKLDHTFTLRELSSLPEKIADPIAIIYDKRIGKANASESNIDVLVEMKVASGKQVICAIQVGGHGHINGLRIDTNKVATAHGNTDSITRLIDAINAHQNGEVSLFYVNKEKTTKVLKSAGNPIPRGLSSLDGFVNSIRDAKSPVKPRFENVTQSTQFKRWFGDWEKHPHTASKVVNSDGTPKIVYHGTNGQFHVFQSGKGEYWFSESDDYAEAMMEERGGGEVKAVYLNMKNPYNAKLSPGQFSDPSFERPILDYAKKNGYDGVIIENDTDDPMAKDTFYVVFNNTQIKSATDNVGTFDGQNPDIRYSLSAARNTEEETAVGETVRQNLNKKGTNYLNGVERRLMNKMADSLGVPRTVQRQELMPTLQKLVDGYLEGGRIDPEQERQLFDEIMDKAMMTNTLFYDTYRDVKDWLRNTEVSIGQEDKAGIPDYANFKNHAFGNVKIVKNGMPVAEAYRQLNQRAPELFPESITTPAEQLQRMYQVSHSIEQSKQSLDDYYGENAETAKQWFRNDMASALRDVMPDLRDVRGYANREKARRIENANVPKTVEEALEAGNDLRKARREYEKIRDKMLIDDEKERIIGKLLRGEMTPEDLQADVYKDMKPGQLLQLYEAKKAYEDLNKRMSAYKRGVKQKLRDEADSVLTDIIEWKDKPMGLLYARETMQRNVLDIVKYRAQGEKINQMYFEPVQIHEAEATRFKNDMRSLVRNMEISTKTADGDKISESAATQIVGEAMDAIAQLSKTQGSVKIGGLNMEQWQGVIDSVFADNPSLDPNKVKSNVESFRKIYDELFQRMNEVRVQFGYEPVPYRSGYFPHFSEETVDNMLVRMGFGIGVDLNADALPTSINGLTSQFKPGIQWFGNALERKGGKTTYDAVKGFDKYIEGVANVIYHTEDIQKLRALESQIRYLSTDDGIRKQVDEVRADTRLTDEEKEDKINKIYEHGRFTLSNFVNELMEYTNLLAGKKSRLDRGVESLLGRKIYSFMKKLEGKLGANMIAGNLGSAITNFIPLQQAAGRLDRGMILEGMWDSLRNMKQGDDFVYRSDFLTNRRGSEALVQTGLEKVSGWLGKPMDWIDGFTSESIVRAAYKQNIRRGLSESEAMHQADLFAAGVMADRSKGAMPTLFESRNPIFKAFTQFQLEVNNQFSEVFKDMPRQAAEEGAAVLAAMLMKYFLLAYLFNDTYEKFTGRRPAMDPFGILNDTVGDFKGYQMPNLWDAGEDLISGEGIDFTTEKVNGQKALQNLKSNVLDQLPFTSAINGGRIPMSAAVPSFTNLTKLNNEDIADEKKREIALTEAQKLGYLVAPFGYGQLQKSWKGVKALLDGGSYTVNNEGEKQLQYPIFQEDMTPGQVLQAAVMGKSSLPQAQQWAENGYKGLNAKQTALYQDLIDAGTKDKVAYDVIQKMAEAEKTEEKSKNQNMLEVLLGMDLSPKARAMTYERSIDKSKTKTFMEENRDNEEVYTTAPEVENAQAKENETVTIAKIREIQRADISDDAKAALYYGMVASDETRELMDKMTDEGASGAEVAKTLMQIQDADRLKGTEKSTAKRNAIADSNLEEEHKLELYRKKISDSKEDEISQFRAAGMDLDTFIEVQNEYSRIKDTGKKASQQAQDFSYWLEKQNLTDRQKKTAKDCFTFYSMVPADAKYFNQAVEAGVDADKAYEVVNKITALKPKAGSNSVSDAQKLRVIVDSGLSEKDMVKMVQSASISTTMKTRLPILVDNGVSIQKQLQFWEKIFDFDADGSGKLNQREVRACLDSFPGGNNNPLEALMGITSSSGPAWTTAEKAAMWQSYNKQFSARKNPYDRKVGEKVKADINAAGEKDKEQEEKQTDKASTGLSTGNAEVDRILGLR